MSKCKHENADHLMPGEFYEHWHHGDKGPTLHAALCEQFRCIDCGAWLSLGEANDTPEAMVECRAAELQHHLIDILPLRMQGWHLDEEHGWRDHGGTGMEPLGGPCPCSESNTHLVGRNWHAGYLARCIATHSEDA